MEEKQHNNEWLKKEITIGQAMGFGLTIFIIVISNWISAQVAITEIKVQQRADKEMFVEFKKDVMEMKAQSERNQAAILQEIKETRREIKYKN